jgi:methionine sulfoxide reductase heme-binding subunit
MARGGHAKSDLTVVFEGWGLVWLATAAIAAASLGVVWWTSADVEGVRLVVRLTARTSAVLFCLAFSASALHSLAPGVWTAWLRRNRRYLGLAFAGSHGLHAVAIAGYAYTDPVMLSAYMNPFMYIFGGLGYAFILAMAATSFDRTAAALGPRAWRILHTVGAYYIWGTFLNGFGMRAMADAGYWPLVALVLAAMAARLAAAAAAYGRRTAG